MKRIVVPEGLTYGEYLDFDEERNHIEKPYEEKDIEITRVGDGDGLSPERKETAKLIMGNIESADGVFKSNARFGGCPANIVTGKEYRGVNSIYLSLVAMNRNYPDNRWCTYAQMKEAGYTFKKTGFNDASRQGVNIEFYAFYDKSTNLPVKQSDLIGLSGDEREDYLQAHARAVRKTYRVYNASIMDGVPEKQIGINSDNPRADKFLGWWDGNVCRIRFDGKDYGYDPKRDVINMKTSDKYSSEGAYLYSLLCEIIHSTGYSDRLDRKLSKPRDDIESFALEEITSSTGAMFLSRELKLDIASQRDPSKAAYLKDWIKKAKKSSDAEKNIYDAIARGEKAYRYAMGEEKEMAEKSGLDERPSEIARDVNSDAPKENLKTLTDLDVYEKAVNSRNGQRFEALYKGKDLHKEQKKNEQEFFKTLAAFTVDVDTLLRIRESSRRPKNIPDATLKSYATDAVSWSKQIRRENATPIIQKTNTGVRSRAKSRGKVK